MKTKPRFGRPTLKIPGTEFWLGAMPDRELARLVGVSHHSVRRWRLRAEVRETVGRPSMARKKVERLVRMLLGGSTEAAAARAAGIAPGSVNRIVKREGLEYRWVRVLPLLMIILVPSWLLW